MFKHLPWQLGLFLQLNLPTKCTNNIGKGDIKGYRQVSKFQSYPPEETH